MAANLIFCGQYFIDTQDLVSYTSPHKKDLLINMKCLTVNYNTSHLLDRMLGSFRKFYELELLVVDGSDEKHYSQVQRVAEKYNVKIHHFGFNIHHGPGLAYGFTQLDDKRIMVIDTDVTFINAGIIERLDSELRDDMYGIGYVQIVNRAGINAPKGIKYLHPAFMLVNKKEFLKWPVPVKHGAPMIETMSAIHDAGKNLLQHAPYVANDFPNPYIHHDWQGTVHATGGYHLSDYSPLSRLWLFAQRLRTSMKNCLWP